MNTINKNCSVPNETEESASQVGTGLRDNKKVSNTSTTPSTKRMSISLSGDAAQLLEFLAQAQGITQNEALRKAIATEAYLFQEMKQGSKVLIQKSDKEVREIIFR